MATENLWWSKARALDRYRWSLLRERHGVFGSAIRFIRESFSDLLFGLFAWMRLSHEVSHESCDFLLLQSAPKVIKFQRKKLLMERLRARGHDLRETALQSPKFILRGRQLKRPPQAVPLRYFAYAAHAEWLVDRYQPRILLNDRNGSLYAPFLRLALNRRERLLVHLAHATTVEASPRLGMIDYDYYFLFGRSSLEALQARPLRFGDSQAVLSGSHMIDRSFAMPPANPDCRVLLVLGVGPDKEKEVEYQRVYEMLRDWAVRHPTFKVLIKAHPRSQVPFWQDAAANISNLQVLPSGCSLSEALEQASVVVNIMSNAVIEAALACRAVVFVSPEEKQDIFLQERFLGERITDGSGLEQRVNELLLNYQEAIEKAKKFSSYHLENGVEGLDFTVDSLGFLLEGKREFLSFPLKSSFDF